MYHTSNENKNFDENTSNILNKGVENDNKNEYKEEVIPKESLDNWMNCKVCQKSCKTNTIFKHLSKSKCCSEEYSLDEVNEISKNVNKKCNDIYLNKDINCKVCQMTFKTGTILEHLDKFKSCDNEYTEDEVKELRNNANKMYIEISLNKDLDCKVCQKPLKTNTILRHLVKSKSCCEEYSVDEMSELRRNSKKISLEKDKIVKDKKPVKKNYPCDHCDLVLPTREFYLGHSHC